MLMNLLIAASFVLISIAFLLNFDRAFNIIMKAGELIISFVKKTKLFLKHMERARMHTQKSLNKNYSLNY